MRVLAIAGLLGVGTFAWSAHAKAADSVPPSWTHAVSGPDWRPPLHYLEDSLQVTAAGGSVLLTNGSIWRVQVPSSGQAPVRTRVTASGTLNGRVLGESEAGLLLSDAFSGPDLEVHCQLSRIGAGGSASWSFELPVQSAGAPYCDHAIATRTGGIATHNGQTAFMLRSDGSQAWIRGVQDIGADPAGDSAPRLDAVVELPGERLLFAGNARFQGTLQHFVWVLDATTGTTLGLHRDGAPGRTLKSRGLPRGGVELLLTADSPAPVQLLRYGAEGAPDGRLDVPVAGREVLTAKAHATGFLLSESDGDRAQLTLLDGATVRWQSAALDFPALASFVFAVAANGAASYVHDGMLWRIDPMGLALPTRPLPPQPDRIMGIGHAPDGTIWVWGRAEQQDNSEMWLSSFAADAGPAIRTTRLALPDGAGRMLALEPQHDGSVRTLVAQYSQDPLAREGRLRARRLSDRGVPLEEFDVAWPIGQKLVAYPMQAGWVVLASAGDSATETLFALDAQGQVLWQRVLPSHGDATLGCDGALHCAVHWPFFEPRLERFDFQGQILASQDIRITPLRSSSGVEVHGLSSDFHMGGTNSRLWSLQSLPAVPLADVTDTQTVLPLLGGLLALRDGALTLHANAMIRPLGQLPGALAQWSSRGDQLVIATEAPVGGSQTLLRLDPQSAAIRRQLQLPAALRLQPPLYDYYSGGTVTTSLDAWDLSREWALARDLDTGRAQLVSTHGEHRIQRIDLDGLAFGVRALPGGDAALLWRQQGDLATARLEVSRFDLPLFRDGLE